MMLGSKSPRSARAWTALLQHASEIPHQQKKTATQEAMNAQNDALLSSWWLNQPIWKILVNLDHFPKDRGENEKCLKPPPSYIYQAMVGWFTLVLYCSRSYHPFSYCYHPFPYWGSLGFVSHRQKPASNHRLSYISMSNFIRNDYIDTVVWAFQDCSLVIHCLLDSSSSCTPED